jgi:Icc-related predicted phosphoesterase
MRLHIISDLHIDVAGGFIPAPATGANAVIVAGDVQEGVSGGLAFLRAHIPRPVPILFVPGNHEFYGHAVVEERAAASAVAHAHDIRVLDDAAVVIGGVRFVGATFWTDFCLNGAGMQGRDMAVARETMNDYRRIEYQQQPWQRFTPEAALALHRASRAFIWETLAQPFGGPTVVITHHAPHPRSIHSRFERAAINPAYVSDQTALMTRFRPALWVHGHVHDSFDYTIDATRVVANPRGYGNENARFDPGLVVEV